MDDRDFESESARTTPDDFLIGRLAVERKLLSSEQLEEAIREQAAARAGGEELLLGQILVRRQWLGTEVLARLLHEQSRRAEKLPELPRYEIRDRVGEGATAVVYRAWDRELGRPVAVKVLRDRSGLSDVARLRFRREGKAAAGLAHPNVVMVHDAGEEVGQPYLVMEFVEGRSFSDLLKARDKDLRVLVEFLEKAARGVSAAHTKGIVHRDLKPANILISAAGEPKVGDFGLAHLVDSSTELTRTGTALGTPLYMSPEQVEGRSKDISPRTDVYALGAILYEILVGRPPHVGQTTMDIYRKIVREEPVPPRRLAATTPRELETIALKALDKNPARRYADAEEFAEDLRRFLKGESIEARPLPAPVRLWRGICRRPEIAVPVTAALLAVGVWTVASRLTRSGFERSDAVLRKRDRAREEALRAVEGARVAVESAPRSLYSKEANYEDVIARVEQARKTIEEAIVKAPDLPTAHYLLGRVWKLEGWEDRAEASFRRAIQLDPEFRPARYELGRLLLELSFRAALGVTPEERTANRPRADRLAHEAARELQAASAGGPGLDDAMERAAARAMIAYARADPEASEIAEAAAREFRGRDGVEDFHWLLAAASASREKQLEAFDRALEIRPKHPLVRVCRAAARQAWGDVEGSIEDCDEAIRAHPRLAEAYYNRGVARRKKGDAEGAVRDFDETLRLRPDYLHAWINRGVCRSEKGELDAALADFGEALRREPKSAVALYNRGLTRLKKGDLEGAVADLTEVIALDAKNAEAYNNRGVTRLKMNRLDEALRDLDRAIEIRKDYAEAYTNRGTIYLRKEDPEAAVEEFDQAIRINPALAEAWYSRGIVRSRHDKSDAAIRDFSRAIELRPGYAEAYYERGLARADAGDLKKAEADLTKAIELAPASGESYASRAELRAATSNPRGAAEDARKAMTLPLGAEQRKAMEALLKKLGDE